MAEKDESENQSGENDMSEDWSLSEFSTALNKAAEAQTQVIRVEVFQYEKGVKIENLKMLETHIKTVKNREANIFLWGFLNHLDYILSSLNYIWQVICKDRREEKNE